MGGGQLDPSDLLARHLRAEVDRCARALDGEPGAIDNEELRALQPLLARQVHLSRLPQEGELLVDLCRTRRSGSTTA